MDFALLKMTSGDFAFCSKRLENPATFVPMIRPVFLRILSQVLPQFFSWPSEGQLLATIVHDGSTKALTSLNVLSITDNDRETGYDKDNSFFFMNPNEETRRGNSTTFLGTRSCIPHPILRIMVYPSSQMMLVDDT